MSSEVSGRCAKRRVQVSAIMLGGGTLTQADLDRAVTYVGVLPKVEEVLRARFLAMVEQEMAIMAAMRGVALDGASCDHERRHRSAGESRATMNIVTRVVLLLAALQASLSCVPPLLAQAPSEPRSSPSGSAPGGPRATGERGQLVIDVPGPAMVTWGTTAQAPSPFSGLSANGIDVEPGTYSPTVAVQSVEAQPDPGEGGDSPRPSLRWSRKNCLEPGGFPGPCSSTSPCVQYTLVSGAQVCYCPTDFVIYRDYVVQGGYVIVVGLPGSGRFGHLSFRSNGDRLPYWDEYEVDGSVTRFARVDPSGLGPAFARFDMWRSEWFVDARDNKTLFEYDSISRVSRIRRPDGVDEVYTYNPGSMIGPGKWSDAFFSGVEVSYVPMTSGPQSDYTVRYLFEKDPNQPPSVQAMMRPFAGDRLIRAYGARMPMLQAKGSDGLFVLPTDLVGTSRYHVTELVYGAGGRVSSVCHFLADSFLPSSARTPSVNYLNFTYGEVPAGSGFYRVASETVVPNSHSWSFQYQASPLDYHRLLWSKRTCSEVGTGVTTHYDWWHRSTLVTIEATSGGRPREMDPDSSGAVEPQSASFVYAYDSCRPWLSKPTSVVDPTGRQRIWTYDELTGLLATHQYPSPSGVGLAEESYIWQPLVAGDLWKGYRRHLRVDAGGRQWLTTYPMDWPRANPEHGVKAQVVCLTSPVPSTAVPAAAVTVTTIFDVSNPTFSVHSGGLRQDGPVGQTLEVTDGDGVCAEYSYDQRGQLVTEVRGVNASPAAMVRTELQYDDYGRPSQITERAGSVAAQVVLLDYNSAGRLIRMRAAVGQQGANLEDRLFYDQYGNLAVRLRKNLDSAGGLPTTLRGASTSAREWLRDEWHYSFDRLVTSFEDRRPLNEGDSGAVEDTPDSRFLRTDLVWLARGLVSSIGLPNGATVDLIYDGYGTLYKRVLRGMAGEELTSRSFINNALEPVRLIEGVGASMLVTTIDRNAAGVVEVVHEPGVAHPGGSYPATFGVKFARHEFDTDILGQTIEARVVDETNGALMRKVKSFYDELGRVYRLEMPDVLGGPVPAVQEVTWTDASKATQVTDSAGRFVKRTFDALGRVTQVEDSRSGQANKIIYEFLDKTDFVASTKSVNFDEMAGVYVEQVTAYTYDTLGRVIQVAVGATSPLVSQYSYFATGDVQTFTDPSGKVEKFLPDALGRLTQRLLPVTTPAANAIWNGSIHQDWAGNATSRLIQEDGEGRLTTSVMDFAGRLSAILEPGGTTMPTAAAPNQPYGKYYAYDANSRLQTMHVGLDSVMQFVRDGAGRVLGRVRGWNPAITPNEHYLVSTFYAGDAVHWDALGRVIETRSYMGDGTEYIREQFTHDGLGRLTAEKFKHLYGTNWNDVVSGYVGADGFRRSVSYQNHLPGSEDLFFTMTPDDVGRFGEIKWAPSSSATPNLLAAYKHEGGAIRRRSTTIPGWSLSPNDTTYTYDHYGRMSGIAHSFSVDAGVTFHYDEASNLVKEVYKKQGAALAQGDQFAYDEHHRLAKAWLGSQNMAVDPDTAAFHKKITYGLDEANNRTGVTEQLGPSGTATTAAYVPDSGTTTGSPSNRYEAAGGIQPLYDTRGNTIFDGFRYYIYDAFNRLTEVYEPVAPSGGSQQMAMSMASEESYGSEESLGFAPISDDPQPVLPLATSSLAPMQAARAAIMARVGADQEALLRRVNDPTLIAEISEPIVLAPSAPAEGASMAMAMESQQSSGPPQLVLRAVYTYDLFNRRVARYLIGEHLYHYSWDGWHEAQQSVNVFDGTILPVTQFAWGEQLDEMVAYRHKPNSTNGVWFSYYIAEGGAHCPSRVLDASGAVVEIQEYDPYGKTTYFNGSGVEIPRTMVGNWFGWKSHRIDPETGLVYMRHRYYLPWWGRFMSQDWLGVWGDRSTFGNSYNYGSASPLVQSDPLGLQVLRKAVPAQEAKVGQVSIKAPRGLNGELFFDSEGKAIEGFSATFMNKGGQGYISLKLGGGADSWHKFDGEIGGAYDWAQAANAANAGEVNPWESEERLMAVADGVEAAASLVPPIGEALDFAIMTDPDAPPAERALAGLSLAGNLLTFGLLPNFSTVRAGSSLTRHSDCLTRLASSAGSATGAAKTRFIAGVRVVDIRTGRVLEGTVDLGPTLDRIRSGQSFPHRTDGGVFDNRPLIGKTTPELPVQAPGYYREFVHPTPGVAGPGPQRIVVGNGGEMYYTPDHYATFIPLQ